MIYANVLTLDLIIEEEVILRDAGTEIVFRRIAPEPVIGVLIPFDGLQLHLPLLGVDFIDEIFLRDDIIQVRIIGGNEASLDQVCNRQEEKGNGGDPLLSVNNEVV